MNDETKAVKIDDQLVGVAVELPYHSVDNDEDCDVSYETLVGPDGFQMTLTEPEDRSLGRDFDPAWARLNEQHAEIQKLRAELALVQQSLLFDTAATAQRTTRNIEEALQALAGVRLEIVPSGPDSWVVAADGKPSGSHGSVRDAIVTLAKATGWEPH